MPYVQASHRLPVFIPAEVDMGLSRGKSSGEDGGLAVVGGGGGCAEGFGEV